MKTNQVMIRPMGQFKVEQRTRDGFFNASFLLKQWNDAVQEDDTRKQKKMANYLDNTTTKEFVEAVKADETESRKTYQSDCQVVIISKARTGSDGIRRAGEVWMHPLVFLDFAMWLNPAFKVKVLKFVADQMIFYRNEAGEAYKRLASAISKIVKPEKMKEAMQQTAEGLNWCIFNNHKTALRNENGTEDNQRKLFELERLVATLIEDGFIKNHDDVMEYLRKQWRKGYIAELQA